MPDPEKLPGNSPLAGMDNDQLNTFAKSLGASNLHTLLDRKDEIAALHTDQLKSMVALGRATRASCGGIDCG
jgi:hypothetical protein